MMSDDTNKGLQPINNDSISDNFKIEIKPLENNTVVVANNENVNSNNDSLVEEGSNDNNIINNEEKTEVIVSETVINADVNTVVEEVKPEIAIGSVEEVSVVVDSDTFNNLNESEIAANSVFNKKEDDVVDGILKEGKENSIDKKGFPYFMVFVFILVVFVAFFIDDITVLVEKYQESKTETVDESISKDDNESEVKKSVTLEEIKKSFANSKEIIDFEKQYGIELVIDIKDNILTFTTTNYFDLMSSSNLTVSYELENNILTAICDMGNSEFGKQMTIFLIKEIAKLQGVTSVNLDSYVEQNLYALTIIDGFELTNSEDGNNTYMVATNVKLNIK